MKVNTKVINNLKVSSLIFLSRAAHPSPSVLLFVQHLLLLMLHTSLHACVINSPSPTHSFILPQPPLGAEICKIFALFMLRASLLYIVFPVRFSASPFHFSSDSGIVAIVEIECLCIISETANSW